MSFYGVSASLLGTYEAVAVATKRVPTVSSWSAARPYRRVLIMLWTIGLLVHLARHEVGE